MPGPVQLNVAPGVDEEPLIATVAAVHVRVCGLPVLAFGAAEFAFTTTVLLAVQPLEGSVTTSVYVPAAFTVGEDVVPPETIPGPLQLKDAPGVVDELFRVPDGDAHVNARGLPAFELGVLVFELTVTDEGAEHPFDGSVTVTV
jgi:hypothetical protein